MEISPAIKLIRNLGDNSDEPFIDVELYGIEPDDVIDDGWLIRTEETFRTIPHVNDKPIKFHKDSVYSLGVQNSDEILKTIEVINWPQGFGKSHNLKNNLTVGGAKNPKERFLSVILGQEHILLKEYDGIEGVQVIGKFKEKCMLYKSEKDVRRLYNNGNGLEPSTICRYFNYNDACDASSCPYKDQFKALDENCSIAITPHLLPLLDISKYGHIYIEENFIGNRSYEWPSNFKTELEKLKGTYEERGWEKLWYELLEKNDEFDFNWFSSHYDNLLEAKLEWNKYVSENATSTNELQKMCCYLKPDDLLLFYKYQKHSYFNNETFKREIPWDYIIFDLLHQYRHINVTYLSASFKEHFFRLNAKRWEKINENVKVNYTIEKVDVKGKIINFCPDLKFPKWRLKDKEFRKETIKKSKANVKRFKEKYKQRFRRTGKKTKIAVLTYKCLIQDDKFAGLPAFHFGANHGVNTFKDFDVLIVIGSYIPNPKSLWDLYKQYYPDNEIVKVNFQGKSNGISYVFNDPNVQKIYEAHFELDEVDGIHRIRPLLSENKEIFIFGYVPSTFLKDGYLLVPFNPVKVNQK